MIYGSPSNSIFPPFLKSVVEITSLPLSFHPFEYEPIFEDIQWPQADPKDNSGDRSPISVRQQHRRSAIFSETPPLNEYWTNELQRLEFPPREWRPGLQHWCACTPPD